MENAPQRENVDKQPKVVITSMGSRYTYLPDGKTQRFKTATGENFEPMDILLFIPPLSEIPDSVKKHYPQIFTPSLSEEDFVQICLSYNPIVPVFRDGTEVNSSSDIIDGDEVFLYFIRDSKPDFHIPVSYKPTIGYSTYDRTVMTKEDGQRTHQHHLGHPVIEIEY